MTLRSSLGQLAFYASGSRGQGSAEGLTSGRLGGSTCRLSEHHTLTFLPVGVTAGGHGGSRSLLASLFYAEVIGLREEPSNANWTPRGRWR